MISHPVAGRLFFAATTLFLLVAPFTSSAGWRAATLTVAMVSAAFLAWRGPRHPSLPAPRALFATLAAFAALAVASLLWSENRALTAGELRSQVLYGAFAFTAFYLGATPARWRVWWRAILVATLVLFIAESLREAVEPRLGLREWDGGAGAFSTHLVIVAPLLLPLAWAAHDGERPRALIFVLAMLALFAAAWTTENRIAWAAFFASFAAAAIARRIASDARPRIEGSRYFAVAGIGLILSLAALTAQMRGAPDHAGMAASLDADLRPRIWSVAIEQVAKAPVLGHGFGREIAAAAFNQTPRPPQHPEILHAHNMFLDVAVQLGLAGLALLLLAFALLARELARALGSRETCAPAVLGLAVLAGFIVKNLTDDFFYRHNGLVFWAVTGMLLGLSRRKDAA